MGEEGDRERTALWEVEEGEGENNVCVGGGGG